MRHLGDITKINGAEIEPVDVITGGSPCQDLSVAGKRAGLAGARSGLFMEQIRIIKEMRQSERDHGRSVQSLRPRYCVWENVPGAFSSNGGKDFQAVLTEFVRVCEENAPDVPLPEKGKWPKAGCLYDELGRWSIAYRLHDAQYWGVPQRRKRLCVLADFNGLTAAELLFDPQYRRGAEDSAADETIGDLGGDAGPEVPPITQGLPRYSQPGGETWEGTAAGTESGSGGADQEGDRTICLQGNGIDRADTAGCNGAGWRRGGCYTLNTIDRPAVCTDESRLPHGGVTETVRAEPHGAYPMVAAFSSGQSEKARSLGYEEEKSPTLRGGEGGNQKPVVMAFAQNQRDEIRDLGSATGALQAQPGMKQQTYVMSVDCRNATEGEVQTTLQAKASGGQSLNCGGVVRVQACDVYNQTVDGETAATVTAAAGGPTQAGQKCFNPWDSQSERVYGSEGTWHSLNANESGGQSRDAVLHTPEERSF